jgi:pSer/pThr/pTyr-binding forkhead associated (FHA) protein
MDKPSLSLHGAHNHGPCPPDFVPLRLVLQPGGMVIELTRPDMTVGRHSEAEIRLPLPDVSRRHCRFVFGNGNWVVMDLNSLNGVFVNEEPVGHATLKQGDRIRIGGFIFAVDLSTEKLPEPTDLERSLAHTLFHGQHTNTYGPHRKAS